MQDTAIQDVLHRHQVYLWGIDNLLRQAQAATDVDTLNALADQVDQAQEEHQSWIRKVKPALEGLQRLEAGERRPEDDAIQAVLHKHGVYEFGRADLMHQAQEATDVETLNRLADDIDRAQDEHQSWIGQVRAPLEGLERLAGEEKRLESLPLPGAPAGDVATQLQGITARVAHLEGRMNSPKLITRDEDGYPTWINDRPVTLNPDGTIRQIG